MPCAHRKINVNQHRTTPRPGTQIRVVEEEAALATFWGWLSAKKTTTAITATIHNNWLGLQLLLQHSSYRVTVAAGCCCSVFLYCGDQSASPNKWSTAQEERRRIYGRQCTHCWGPNMNSSRSFHFLPQLYLSSVSRVEDLQ